MILDRILEREVLVTNPIDLYTKTCSIKGGGCKAFIKLRKISHLSSLLLQNVSLTLN